MVNLDSTVLMRCLVKMESLKAKQILAKTQCQMIVQEAALSTIPIYHPVSPFDWAADEQQHAGKQYQLVHNMAMPMLNPTSQLILDHRAFLRRVEQVSQHRPQLLVV